MSVRRRLNALRPFKSAACSVVDADLLKVIAAAKLLTKPEDFQRNVAIADGDPPTRGWG